jgi:hypothetical protein
VTLASGGTPPGLSGPSNNAGWTAGLGVEWAFYGNWSARAEYDFIGLTNQTWTVNSGAFTGSTVTSSNRNIQLVTAGGEPQIRRLVVTASVQILPKLGPLEAPGSTPGLFLCRRI